MLRFAVYVDGNLADRVNLTGAYVLGSDEVPLRAEISCKDGIIQCTKRAAGPAGIAILWDVKECGRILIETLRLQARQEPYILQVELARSRLFRLSQKIEDWGLAEHEDARKQLGEANQARDLLIRALQADTPGQAAVLGDQALAKAVQASESLAELHAGWFLTARRQARELPRRVFGCAVHLDKPSEASRERVAAAVDFVSVPISWKNTEPNEQTFHWKSIDAWIELLTKERIPIKGSALLSFQEGQVPDWLYIWEHDFDTIRDLAFEHIRRVINRYGQYIETWDVISGIHANNCFTFNFEQLMELTRMAAAVAKQTAPRSQAIIELVTPWGEYYSRNQRTIPPLLYADMVVQSGVPFDAFGLQFLFGPAADGMLVRDMFQISSVLDAYARVGKPLHITASQVPSRPLAAKNTGGSSGSAGDGGHWHSPWSEEIQSEWLREFVTIALSKPFVESVSWYTLADHPGQIVPHGGLLRSDLVPKAGYQQLNSIRSALRMGKERSGRK